MEIILLSIILLAIAVAGIAIKILVKKMAGFREHAAVIILCYKMKAEDVVYVALSPRRSVKPN